MNELERELETMMGIQAGITIALASVISTHPDHEKLQLAIARNLEFVAPAALWPTLSEKSQKTAVGYVECLQRIAATPGESDPLSQLGFQWRGREWLRSSQAFTFRKRRAIPAG